MIDKLVNRLRLLRNNGFDLWSTLQVRNNGYYKLVALFITLALWATFLGRRDINETLSLRLEFFVAQDRIISNEVPQEAEVRLFGPHNRIQQVRQSRPLLTMDLTNSPLGLSVVPVSTQVLNLPLGVSVLSVSPDRVSIQLDPLVKRNVPVRIQWEQPLPLGWKVERVQPEQVELQGAASVLSRIESVSTLPISTRMWDTERMPPEESVISANILLPKRPGVLPLVEQVVLLFLKYQEPQ